jgi:hypothetical protein
MRNTNSSMVLWRMRNSDYAADTRNSNPDKDMWLSGIFRRGPRGVRATRSRRFMKGLATDPTDIYRSTDGIVSISRIVTDGAIPRLDRRNVDALEVLLDSLRLAI